jgi:hypothetical protein
MTFHKRLHTHRTLEFVQVALTKKAAICAAFPKPSDGLEPSTPSLPWRRVSNQVAILKCQAMPPSTRSRACRWRAQASFAS